MDVLRSSAYGSETIQIQLQVIKISTPKNWQKYKNNKLNSEAEVTSF